MTDVQEKRQLERRNNMSTEEFLAWKQEVETRLRVLEAAIAVIQASTEKDES